MKLPPAFRAALTAEVAKALPGMIERAWAAYQAVGADKPTPSPAPPRKRRPSNKIEKGRARIAILATIKRADEDGITRADIRLRAPDWLNGKPISENTLKSVLMFLRENGDIETKNSRWYATRLPVRTERQVSPYMFAKNAPPKEDV